MKKCLFLMLMFVCVSMMGQEPYKVFCELLGTGKLFSTKVTVTVDFGQETKFWTGNSKEFLVDENGKKIIFNSMVDAMNYMGKRGWKFEQAYVVTTSNQNVYHWLLSKEVTQDEMINDGFDTKRTFQEKEEAADSKEQDVADKKKKRSRIVQDDIYN